MPNYDSFKKIILTTIALLSIANLVTTNILATKGVKLKAVNLETSKIAEENQILRIQLQEVKSLQTIETKALSQGFVKSTNILVLGKTDILAEASRR